MLSQSINFTSDIARYISVILQLLIIDTIMKKIRPQLISSLLNPVDLILHIEHVAGFIVLSKLRLGNTNPKQNRQTAVQDDSKQFAKRRHRCKDSLLSFSSPGLLDLILNIDRTFLVDTF